MHVHATHHISTAIFTSVSIAPPSLPSIFAVNWCGSASPCCSHPDASALLRQAPPTEHAP